MKFIPSMPTVALLAITALLIAVVTWALGTAVSHVSAPPTAAIPTQEGRAPTSPQNMEIMAWIYPGEPGCRAAEEYADGRQIDVLKPEYYLVGDGGRLILLTEAEAGCNGFSPANVADVRAHSREQFVTVSSADARSMAAFFDRASEDGDAIAELVNFTETHEFNGVELDFETFAAWSPGLYEEYKAFATRLGNALHERDKELMLVGPAIGSDEEASWFPWRYEDFVALPVDHMVVMAYDRQYDHGAGTPIAPLAWLDDVTKRTLEAFPDTSRLSIGISSYAYRGQDGTQILRLMPSEEAQRVTGDWVRDPSSGELVVRRGQDVYFFHDTESMDLKRARVARHGITSISVWSLGGNPWFSEEAPE